MHCRFSRHARDGTCVTQYKLYSSDKEWMPKPECEDDIVKCSLVGHAYVGGRKKFLESLGVGDAAKLVTKEQQDLFFAFTALETDFEELQLSIMNAHPEGGRDTFEDPLKVCEVPVTQGYMRFLDKCPSGLVAEARPPKLDGADQIAKAAKGLLADINNSKFSETESDAFTAENFERFMLTSREKQWLLSRNSRDNVLGVHETAKLRAGAWVPMIKCQDIDRTLRTRRLHEIDMSCNLMNQICADMLVPSRERGLQRGQEVMTYDGFQQKLQGESSFLMIVVSLIARFCRIF